MACRVAWMLSTNGSTPGHSGPSSTAARTWPEWSRRYSRAILDVVPSAITFHRSTPSATRRSSASAAQGRDPRKELLPRPRVVHPHLHGRVREGVDLRAAEARLGPARPADIQH